MYIAEKWLFMKAHYLFYCVLSQEFVQICPDQELHLEMSVQGNGTQVINNKIIAYEKKIK